MLSYYLYVNGAMERQNGHSEFVRFACITANVGTVFEKMDTHFPLWLDTMMKKIHNLDVDILALHMQEIGGKTAGPKVNDLLLEFMTRLCCAMHEQANFVCACIYADPDSTNKCKYTALACCYFSRLPDCSIYNNITQNYDQLLPLASMKTAKGVLLAQNFADDHVYKMRFHVDLAARPSFRKGYAHVTLQVRDKQIDLINMHLFHDESNIVAVMQTTTPMTPTSPTMNLRTSASSSELELPTNSRLTMAHMFDNQILPTGPTMSAYALRRRKAFSVALADCRQRIEARVDSSNHLLIIFGDLNTRLRAGALIEQYTIDRNAELIAIWEAQMSEQLEPCPIVKDPLMRTASAGDFDVKNSRQIENFKNRKTSCVFYERNKSKSPCNSLNPTITTTCADSESEAGSTIEISDDDSNRNRSDSCRSDVGGDLITSTAGAPHAYQIVHKTSRQELIFVGQKKFKLTNCEQSSWTLENYPKWLTSDIEAELEAICSKENLYECAITFAPTYPYREEASANDPHNWSLYDSTRIPAWCDRVLFNQTAKNAIRQFTYTSVGQHECTGDHKPVLLLAVL